jgi:hypothetical protein
MPKITGDDACDVNSGRELGVAGCVSVPPQCAGDGCSPAIRAGILLGTLTKSFINLLKYKMK